MPEPVRDQALRDRALDPLDSFIVQAPAGSGKTELLIQRFLTLLSRVDLPESIVAITFTRKAAGEMRHRMVDALREAEGEPPREPHNRHTWELARSALGRDEACGWRLKEFPARLRIQTIDSLCGSLVGRMPWISRMGVAPEPEEHADHLYHRAARETLTLLRGGGEPAEAVDRLLRHLDNDTDVLEDLLVGMLRCRDQWLRHVVGDTATGEFRHALESAFAHLAERERSRLRSMFAPDQVSSLLETARFAVRHLPPTGPENPLARLVASDQLPGIGAGDDVEQWLALAGLLLKDDGKRRKRPDARQGFPATRAGRAAIARFQALKLDDALLRRLHALRSLPPSSFSDDQWEVLNAMGSLLPLAAAQLKIVFRQEGRVDFTETAHAARTALGTPEEPTDLAFALDCRIEHLLVDEFQDTSQTQYELLESLTAEWIPGDGRTLFLVGDPMQSIYGFREADVALFLKVRKDGIGNVRPVPLTLSVNFRSEGGIVRWVNRAMPPAFASEEDLLTGAVEYVPSEAYHPELDPQAVTIHPFFDDDLTAEAVRVLELIRESVAADPEGRIAVLVRARAHLGRIVSTLRANDIPFQAVEIDRLIGRGVVQDLLALTRALLHPADRTAWLAILRAPWCGLTLADLNALIGSDFAGPVWDLMVDPARMAALTEDGLQRLERLKSVLGPTLASRGRVPLRRWVESTWMALGGPAVVAEGTDLEDAVAYLDLVDDLSDGAELRDLDAFEEAVDSLFARPDVNSDGRLQLLTVHKAKGLEFDTVILPGLGRATREEEQQLMLWLEQAEEGDARLLLAPIKARGSDPDPRYRYLARIKRRKLEHEASRLLYVAATRARQHLHLLGHTRVDPSSGRVKRPAGRSLLSKIWHVAGPDFEAGVAQWRKAFQTNPGVGGNIHIALELRRLSPDWVPPAPRPDVWWPSEVALDRADAGRAAVVRFDWATDLRRRVGIVVHAFLQRGSGRLGEAEFLDRASIMNALAAEGVAGRALREATDRVTAALEGVWADGRGRWILGVHQEDRREYRLSGVVDGRIRRCILDRTFVEDGVRWIIDYKTGMHEGSGVDAFLDSEQSRYRAQLEDYARLMQGLDERPIRLGLYFPLLQGWREWEFSESLAGVEG